MLSPTWLLSAFKHHWRLFAVWFLQILVAANQNVSNPYAWTVNFPNNTVANGVAATVAAAMTAANAAVTGYAGSYPTAGY